MKPCKKDPSFIIRVFIRGKKRHYIIARRAEGLVVRFYSSA